MIFKIFSQPEVEPLPHSNFWILKEDYCFFVNEKPYWIPKGYVWDGASIPRIVWGIIGAPSEPDFLAASLIHDWIYLTHIFTRAEADEAIFQILKQSDVSLWRRRCIWAAVRTFGGIVGAWATKSKDKAQISQINANLELRNDKEKFGYPLAA